MNYRYRKSAETHKKLPPLKHILALPTWGQKCTQTELQSFEIGNFDLGHPVRLRELKVYTLRFFYQFFLKPKTSVVLGFRKN